MTLKKILQGLDFSLDREEDKKLNERAREIVSLLKDEIKKQKIDADVFLGGSFAKGTLMKSDKYDVDIFIRFDWKYEDLSKPLENVVNALSKSLKLKNEKVHGSRDYFRIIEGNRIFEMIPVTKINKPKEARNVTDLSYFHVSYVKKKLNARLRKEILLAKAFAKAQEVYGAESYIGGLSGYALECLVIHYKSFERMLKEILKSERLIIDPEKQYKKKEEILVGMNESRLHSPIVIVDPTWKERNVTAALSNEVYDNFRKKIKLFLARPSKKFFEVVEFNVENFKRNANKGSEYLHLILKTDKQSGDIAGTKMKKFSKFLQREIGKYFKVERTKFEYSQGQESDFYLILKSKEKLEIIGPPLEMKEAVSNFKKNHRKNFEKSGRVCAETKIDFSASEFIKRFKQKNDRMIKSMDITGIDSV